MYFRPQPGFWIPQMQITSTAPVIMTFSFNVRFLMMRDQADDT